MKEELHVGVWLFIALSTTLAQPPISPLECVTPLHIDIMKECGGGPGDGNNLRTTPNSCNTPVTNDPVCKRTMNITIIDIPPFSNQLIPHFFLRKVLPACCGECVKYKVTNNFNGLDHFYKFYHDVQKQVATLNSTNVVFPLFGDYQSDRLHGYFFLPIFDLVSATLLTKPREDDDLMMSLLSGVFTTWPLLLICLLMACIAGFVAWILETWKNNEEFRRPFFQGLLDGFWWSFVSMTTVGYGDKAPKSLSARIFSVFWILCGITICSMFTATLTNAITSAATPVSPTMSAKDIGVQTGRLFDMSIVVAQGGRPKERNTVQELLDMLDNEEVDGVLLDSYTLKFFVSGAYIETLAPFYGNMYSYGIGFADVKDHDYYKGILGDNKLLIETCLTFAGDNVKVDLNNDIFSPNSSMFYSFFGGSMVILFLILIFGVIYEIRRTGKIKQAEEGFEEKQAHPPKTTRADGRKNEAFQGHFVTQAGKRNMELAANFSAR